MPIGFSLPFGPFTSLPPALINLPFNLLRSQLYPGSPGVVAAAVEEGANPQNVQYLPQKFGFRRWKEQGFDPRWTSVVSSPIRAFGVSTASAMTSGATASTVRMNPINQAALQNGLRLPQPTDNLSSFAPPIAPGIPRLGPMTPDQLNQIAQRAEDTARIGVAAANAKMQEAMGLARSALAKTMGVIR